MLELQSNHFENRKLETLVENRTIYTLNTAELNVFETHEHAEKVVLRFGDPVLASMIKGKKVMHLKGQESFAFLPGESLILPSNEEMCIDFPEAKLHNPTQCLALSFSPEKIAKTVQFLNETYPKADYKEWSMTDYNFHFTNDLAIAQILQRLLFVFAENHVSKDIFAESMIQELLIRILQNESKSSHLLKAKGSCDDDRIAYVIKYIQSNLSENLTVEVLSEVASMSQSSFFRTFKNEIGLTPNEFIIESRIKLVEDKLKEPKTSIKEAYLSSGFNSFSYFCRIFKKKRNLSPTEFKNSQLEGFRL